MKVNWPYNGRIYLHLLSASSNRENGVMGNRDLSCLSEENGGWKYRRNNLLKRSKLFPGVVRAPEHTRWGPDGNCEEERGRGKGEGRRRSCFSLTDGNLDGVKNA